MDTFSLTIEHLRVCKILIESWLLIVRQCIQVQNFLTSAESKAFVKAAESIGFVHQGSLGPTKGQAYRDNDRISVNDPVLADTIWESGLDKLFSDIKIRGKAAVGLNPNIRFYRLVISFCEHDRTNSKAISNFELVHYLISFIKGRGFYLFFEKFFSDYKQK